MIKIIVSDLHCLEVSFKWLVESLKDLQFEILDCDLLSHVDVAFDITHIFSKEVQVKSVHGLLVSEEHEYILKEFLLLKQQVVYIHSDICSSQNPYDTHYNMG